MFKKEVFHILINNCVLEKWCVKYTTDNLSPYLNTNLTDITTGRERLIRTRLIRSST